MKYNACFWMKLLILLLCLGGLYGCGANNKFSDLFVLTCGEQRTLAQEKERLKYGKLLQPEVSGDSLVVPRTDDVPIIYKKYANVFVDSLNKFLKKMPEEDKYALLISFRLNTIGTSLINSYVEKEDSLYVLKITRESAIFLGLEDEYDEIQNFVGNLNLFLPNYSRDIVEAIEKSYEKPRSIFWASHYFNGTIKDFYEIRNCILNLGKS